MFKMVDGTGTIGVDMICPLGVSTPQPPNYDRVELEGTGMLVLPNSLDAPLERLELGGKTEQVQTSGKNLFDPNNNYEDLVWIRNDGEIVGGSNARTSDYISVEQGNYAFQFDVINYNQMFVAGYNTDKQFVKIVGTISRGKCIIKIDNIEIETIRLSYTRESTRIQLERSETQTPYEPYTGGKPAPSPEYPQEIKSVGKWNGEKQKYEVDVKITGKNLFDIEKASEKANWTQHNNFPGYYNFPVFVGKDNTVTISIPQKIPTGQGLFLSVCLSESGGREGWIAHNSNASLNNAKLTYKATTDYIYLNAHSDTIAGMERFFGELQIECGNVATPYQPYTEQSLTLTSDRPLTKWDKLVEQDGQIGWLYKSKVYDGFDGKNNRIELGNKVGNVRHFLVYFASTPNSVGNANSYCDKYIGVNVSWTKEKFGIFCDWNNGVKFFSAPNENVATVDEFKAWLVENPLKIAYETTKTEFIPLPQSEQNTIRALKTYYPTTVITADGGELDPDIKATYRKEI